MIAGSLALARAAPSVRSSNDETCAEGAHVSRLFEGYEPHAKQLELHRCRASRVVIVAGRRSGKTYAVAREFLRRVFLDLAAAQARGASWLAPTVRTRNGPRLRIGPQTKPLLHYWIVAPTYDLTDMAAREVFAVLGGELGPLVLKYNANSRALWLRGGILIEFKSAEDPKSLVSVGLNGLWLEEAARCKPSVWRENLRATVSDRQGWVLFTTTPLGQNWFYHEVWALTDKGSDAAKHVDGWQGFHFTSADNTSLPHMVEEQERARRELSKATYLRNYKADFNAFEGKIYEDFLDDETHITMRLPRTFKRTIAAMDWGYRNPGCLLAAGIDRDGDLWVVEEVFKTGVLIASDRPGVETWCKIAAAAARRWQLAAIYGDPSEPEHLDALRAYFRDHKLPTAILAADNAVGPGIQAVATLLRPTAIEPGAPLRPALRIAASCSNLRRELSSYRWKEGDAEEPVKVDDHACDTLRYLVYTEQRRGGEGFARLHAFPALFGRTA